MGESVWASESMCSILHLVCVLYKAVAIVFSHNHIMTMLTSAEKLLAAKTNQKSCRPHHPAAYTCYCN